MDSTDKTSIFSYLCSDSNDVQTEKIILGVYILKVLMGGKESAGIFIISSETYPGFNTK